MRPCENGIESIVLPLTKSAVNSATQCIWAASSGWCIANAMRAPNR